MSESIIKVENLSKRFIISHEEQERYTSLRDVVTRKIKSAFSFGSKKRTQPGAREEFWALKDLNFEIKHGDRVGIIGRNGAGKSTLLKILSRITEPTKGRIEINGRVASLLEVGTGFHPELTGRENIFLNGAILGMSRAEIKSKFDEIVAFAEVEQFLDTPVKRYSSGMYVRLAFAVAAHLEPEILIVDEVLAVGDAQFQKKCLGKMEEVSVKGGRTVIFVSHNIRLVQNLCNDALVLDEGGLLFHGDKGEGIMKYEMLSKTPKADQRQGRNITSIQVEVLIKDLEGGGSSFNSHKGIQFVVHIFSKKDFNNVVINVCIDGVHAERIGHLRSDWDNFPVGLKEGSNWVSIKVDQLRLAPGVYDVWSRVTIPGGEFFDSDTSSIQIDGPEISGVISFPGSIWSYQGSI